MLFSRRQIIKALAATLGCSTIRVASAASGAAPAIPIDVLVVGCGVLGMCAVRELASAGYQVLGVERGTIGGGQTCHSHVYIHRGHIYETAPLIERLSDSDALWRPLIESGRIEIESRRSFFGFADAPAMQRRLEIWRKMKLPFSEATVPATLAHGVVKVGVWTPEATLNGGSLMRYLSRGLEARLTKVSGIDDIELVDGGSAGWRISSLSILTERGKVHVSPKMILFAGGAGNIHLARTVAEAQRDADPRLGSCQTLRMSHMLIISGSAASLPRVSGVFPDIGGLFIGVRDEGAQRVWLVSDDRSPRLRDEFDSGRLDARWWLPRVIDSLKKLSPQWFRSPNGLRWGTYEATKAEPSAKHWADRRDRIEDFGLQNAVFAWPTKLTLAPKVARELKERVSSRFPSSDRPIPPEFAAIRVQPRVAEELWRQTQLVSWSKFRKRYGLGA
ncbi:FAD-dependent oxidoreductase [Corallococcus sp. 4LFB]|uniref:FAD-dependent oxidoreductase n=1 Tax=Corallococcus sp. 4LFB TaxID=3383249 RepID=UPI003975C538